MCVCVCVCVCVYVCVCGRVYTSASVRDCRAVRMPSSACKRKRENKRAITQEKMYGERDINKTKLHGQRIIYVVRVGPLGRSVFTTAERLLRLPEFLFRALGRPGDRDRAGEANKW